MINKPILNFREILSLFIPRRINKNNILDVWRKKEDKSIFLSKSSWSLALISLMKKEEIKSSNLTIWIPSYFCNESLYLLRLTSIKLVFYPIKENLEPDYDSFNKLKNDNGKPDIFLLVHFFGKPIDAVKTLEFCRANNTWLIEDAVHCLTPSKKIGINGDFILYSPHKLLPIPNGSILIARNKGPSKISNKFIDNYFENSKWKNLLFQINILKKSNIKNIIRNSTLIWSIKQILIAIGIRRYIKFPFNYSQTNPNYNHKPEISFISLMILNIICKKLNPISLIRKYNYIYWENHFSQLGFNSISNNIKIIGFENFNWSPYLFSIESEKNKIQSLYNNLNPKKYLPSTWPDLPPEVLKDTEFFSIAIRKRNSMLHIPIHHSINKSFFRKINNDKLNEFAIKSEWNNVNQSEWNELIKKTKNSNLLQLWSYGEAKSKSEGWIVNRVVYYFNNKIIAYTQILEKNFFNIIRIYRINRGPIFITDDKELKYSVIKNLMSLSNIFKRVFVSASIELKITPSNLSFINSLNPKLMCSKGYTSIWINLNDSVEEIRNKLDSKWRNMLVKSEKQDIQIESSSSIEYISWLSEIHEKNMTKKGFKGISKKMLQSISNENDLENPLIVYKAIIKNNAIGSICIINHGKFATYLLGWTSNEGRKLNTNYLLLWEAIKDLKRANKLGFDLGGINYELTPTITSFKSKMNGQNYNLVPTIWK